MKYLSLIPLCLLTMTLSACGEDRTGWYDKTGESGWWGKSGQDGWWGESDFEWSGNADQCNVYGRCDDAPAEEEDLQCSFYGRCDE